MSAADRRRRPTRSWAVARLGVPSRRMTALWVGFLVVALILGGACVYIQGFDPSGNAAQAMRQASAAIPAMRGTIYDRNGLALAQSEPAVNITADPSIVATNGGVPDSMGLGARLRAQAGAGIIAGTLVAYVGGDFDDYYTKLSTTTTSGGTTIRYTMLARSVLTYVNLQIADRLSRWGYVGLYREQAPIRTYPNGALAANVIGYMMYDNDLGDQGKYPWVGGGGLEASLDANLAGIDGQEVYESSPYGRIPQGSEILQPAQPGVDYTLTLDAGLQYMQDQRLAAGVEATGARSGMMVTMNIKTGEILALSNYPTFDPNHSGSADQAILKNPAAENAYEPGSVEKVLTMAALVDQGLATPDTRVIVPGSIPSGGHTITDAWSHGTLQLTATGVITNSSNVGMTLLTRQIDKSVLAGYLSDFGLGHTTNLGLPGESSGSLPSGDMSDQTRDQISFGQGLSVTAIQEAAAVAAVADGGLYHSPTIIASGSTSDGRSVEVPATTSRQVVSPEAAGMVLQMMEAMIQSHDSTLGIPGYRTGGKSGTAQAIDPACGCYRGLVVSFVGVAPIEDPQLLTYVVLDHPAGNTSGTAAAAPIYKDIMTVALARYGVSLSTEPAPTYQTQW